MAKSTRNQIERETPSNNAESLADQIVGALPILLGVAAVAVVGILIYSFINSRNAAARASASTSFFFSADDPDAMESVYRKHPGTAAALWARQTQADAQLAEASYRWYLDREASDELASAALDNYEVVMNESVSDMMKTRATLGAARANEALGNLDEAVTLYKDVLAADASEVLTEQINEKLDFLESESGKDFFVWYKDFKPFDASGLDLPSNLNSLPTEPDLDMPEFTPAAPAAPTGTGLSTPDFSAPSPATPTDSAPGLKAPPIATESTDAPEATTDTPAGGVTDGEMSETTVPAEGPAVPQDGENPAGENPAAETAAIGEPATETEPSSKPLEVEKPVTEKPVTEPPVAESTGNSGEPGSSRPPRVEGVKKDK